MFCSDISRFILFIAEHYACCSAAGVMGAMLQQLHNDTLTVYIAAVSVVDGTILDKVGAQDRLILCWGNIYEH